MTKIIVARVAFRSSRISFELKVKLVLESFIFAPSDKIYYFVKEKQLWIDTLTWNNMIMWK